MNKAGSSYSKKNIQRVYNQSLNKMQLKPLHTNHNVSYDGVPVDAESDGFVNELLLSQYRQNVYGAKLPSQYIKKTAKNKKSMSRKNEYPK